MFGCCRTPSEVGSPVGILVAPTRIAWCYLARQDGEVRVSWLLKGPRLSGRSGVRKGATQLPEDTQ